MTTSRTRGYALPIYIVYFTMKSVTVNQMSMCKYWWTLYQWREGRERSGDVKVGPSLSTPNYIQCNDINDQ
jgi:hypothetical protein